MPTSTRRGEVARMALLLVGGLLLLGQRAGARCAGSAFRASGSTIAMLVPGYDQPQADTLTETLRREVDGGPSIRLGTAVWQPADDGERVIERAMQAAKGAAVVA